MKDKWLERVKLRKEFSRLYDLSLNKDNTLNQVGQWFDASLIWKLGWRRKLFVWELDQVDQLLSLLVNKEVIKEDVESDKDDIWIWRKGVSGSYTVKSAYSILRKYRMKID